MKPCTDDAHDATDLLPERWAWEFLRRNQEYREDYKRWVGLLPYVTSKYSSGSHWLAISQARQADRLITVYEPVRRPDESFQEWQCRCLSQDREPKTLSLNVWLAHKWALDSLADPDMPYGPTVRFRKPEFPVQVTWDDVETYFVPCDEEGAPEALPDPRRPLIAFDVQQPLEPQLKRAAAKLEQLAAANGSANSRGANWRPDVWRVQLQVLDARAAGKSLKEIASLLFPEKDRSTHCGPDHFAKRVSEVHLAARKKVDSGYRRILEQ